MEDLKGFAIAMASYFLCEQKVTKRSRPPSLAPSEQFTLDSLGDTAEQTTALPPRSAMPLSPWTPGVTTRAFSTVIASYARRGAAVELTSFLRRCRSSCGHCEKLRCPHNAPGVGKILEVWARMRQVSYHGRKF